MRTRRKRYSAEFKREALKRASEEGMTDVRVGVQHEASDEHYRYETSHPGDRGIGKSLFSY